MAGTILENLSGKKLAVLVSVILLCQIACFLIGGLVAPAPSNAETVLGTKCLREVPISQDFFSSNSWEIPRGPQQCNKIDDIGEESFVSNPKATADKIVFAFQIPLPKYGQELDYSRWMQNLITVLWLDIEYQEYNVLTEKATLTLMVKVGYRNKGDAHDKWSLLAHSTTERTLDCHIDKAKKQNGYLYDCEMMSLFELGSLHHDYYLINIGLPVVNSKGKSVNDGIGYIKDIYIAAINQNGGFTKVWVSLKTAFFPIIIATMIWYWNRIKLLARPPMLLERMLLTLGASITLLNFPVEFLTLWIDLPFTLLLSDVRQGLFYSCLLSFWLVFCGEHLMDGRKDDVDRNKLRSYWKHLSAVVIGCFCLFLFDVCERGVQLFNPFYSLWTFDAGTKLALAFIIIAGASACIYFFFLCYMVFRVFRNISFKRNALPSMSSTRRMFYEGIIYRFKFLMMATLICAALTVISFIMGQASEARWKYEDNVKLQYTSAFFTGVYGMWNCYIFTLLCMYAPSHKHYPPLADLTASSQEEIEFSCLTASDQPSASEITEVSSLTEFAKKQAMD